MERALKERIIGAIVLVAVVVLVVPVFLDGPPNNGGVVSEVVKLPGQDDQQSQTIVLDRDRDEPVPAQPAAEQPRPEPVRQAPVQQAAAERDPPPPDPQPAAPEPEVSEPQEQEPVREPAPQPVQAASTTGMWAVQLGSFSNQANAEKLAADLRREGFAAFLSQLNTDAAQLHRVRVGPQKDREAAEAMAARLKNAGHEVKVLPHP